MLEIKKLTLGPLQTNCYILYDKVSGEAAVVDPADCGEIINSNLKSMGLELKYIIITHAHADHINAVDYLKEKTNAPVCISRGDSEALNSPVLSLCMQFGFAAPKSKADIVLNEGDRLFIGDNPLCVIETPGHTAGGICLYTPGSLISGDTLFFESVGRWDFEGGNFDTLMNSIKDKLFTLPGDTKVYPGHGDATAIGYEKINNTLVI